MYYFLFWFLIFITSFNSFEVSISCVTIGNSTVYYSSDGQIFNKIGDIIGYDTTWKYNLNVTNIGKLRFITNALNETIQPALLCDIFYNDESHFTEDFDKQWFIKEGTTTWLIPITYKDSDFQVDLWKILKNTIDIDGGSWVWTAESNPWTSTLILDYIFFKDTKYENRGPIYVENRNALGMLSNLQDKLTFEMNFINYSPLITNTYQNVIRMFGPDLCVGNTQCRSPMMSLCPANVNWCKSIHLKWSSVDDFNDGVNIDTTINIGELYHLYFEASVEKFYVSLNGTNSGFTEYLEEPYKEHYRTTNIMIQTLADNLITPNMTIWDLKIESIKFPTNNPTNIPTIYPTKIPTIVPTIIPTQNPSEYPTVIPTLMPSKNPSFIPTYIPTKTPTELPSLSPTIEPSMSTKLPSNIPTTNPTDIPTLLTNVPTNIPSIIPTVIPTENTPIPTKNPSDIPTFIPTSETNSPTNIPTYVPSVNPSTITQMPTTLPTNYPTIIPTTKTDLPTKYTETPTNNPTYLPTNIPTLNTKIPSISPTIVVDNEGKEKLSSNVKSMIIALVILMVVVAILTIVVVYFRKIICW